MKITRELRFWLPMCVSLLALSVSGFQWIETRRHDRLIVRPLVDFTMNLDDRANSVGMDIENVGFGPAVVKSLIIYIDESARKIGTKRLSPANKMPT
jgi:hypothetical protein